MNDSTVKKPSLLRQLMRTFLAGLLAALPLTLTLAAIAWLAEFIQRFLGPTSSFGKLLGSIGLKFVASETSAYILGVVATLLLIYFLGVLIEAGMKSRWHALIDNVLNRVPLVRTIYNALTRLTQMFELKDQSEVKSMRAVMCYFGGKSSNNKAGTAILALLTNPEPIHMNGHDYYAIMIPTAPVPFGGAIMYIPIDWVEPADVSFDGLFNIYMSMGVTSPEYLHKPPAQQTSDSKPE